MALELSSPDNNTVNWMAKRITAPPGDRRRVSLDEYVPNWQRQWVWTDEQVSDLIVSILHNYPIGLIVMWERPTPDGKTVYVPVDGLQRLSAISKFRTGLKRIEERAHYPREWQGRAYCPARLKEDPKLEHDHRLCLSPQEMEQFDNYQLRIAIAGPETEETELMQVFVNLQGGNRLNNAEIRAALGGRVCDFVTELVYGRGSSTPTAISEDEQEDEARAGQHRFFTQLGKGYANRRKGHRGVCDQLLNEYLNMPAAKEGRLDHHHETLLRLYRRERLTKTDQEGFRRFLDSVTLHFSTGDRFPPTFNKPNVICSWVRAFSLLDETYGGARKLPWGELMMAFEAARAATAQDHVAKKLFDDYTTSIAASGYTSDRMRERTAYIVGWVLEQGEARNLSPKDPRRAFTPEQRYVIWYRAGGQCEHEDMSGRCQERYKDPYREWDADHIVEWSQGGATDISNGRLLCPSHNRSRN